MILTANDFVNVRLGRPSVNAENPAFLSPGKTVNAKARVIGDTVNHNSRWILTEENEFLSEEGFVLPDEFKAVDLSINNTGASPLFDHLQIAKLWKSASMGEAVKIGIIDNGVAKHPALSPQIRELNSTRPEATNSNEHGTTMACIIAAFDEKSGKLGVAPKVSEILSYSIEVTQITPQDLITALKKMHNENVNVVNMSFAINKEIFRPRFNGRELQNVITELTEQGMVIVCATGNEFNMDTSYYPAAYENIISVAGYLSDGFLDINSNLWPNVSIAMSSEHYFNDGQREKSNGTSGAAAIISGCISCVYHRISGSNKTGQIIEIFRTMSPIDLKPGMFSMPVRKFDINHFLKI